MSTAVRQAIHTKLNAISGVSSVVGSRVFHGHAPEGTAFPLVVFNKQAGTKTRAFRTPNAFNEESWLIKVIDRGDTSNTAEQVAEAIDAAFDGGSLSVSGKTVADLHHVSDVDYLEPVGDQTYRHHGSVFAVVLTAN